MVQELQSGQVANQATSTKPARNTDLIGLIFEALGFPVSGEVIVRSGEKSGRIFAASGKIAWVTASSVKRTLTDRLVAKGVPHEDLTALYKECNQSGRNFAEAIIEWGLLEREELRTILLQHIARSLYELFSWPSPEGIVIASDKGYSGQLTYELRELIEQASEHDSLGSIDREGLLARLRELESTAATTMNGASAPSPSATAGERGASGQSTSRTAGAGPASSGQPREAQKGYRLTEEQSMNLEAHLQELRSIKGYIASNILNWTGELIANDTVDASVDAALLSTMCNDVFNSAHECVEKTEMGECTETIINMPIASIILRCSGKASKTHIHVGCILSKDGNSALARMTIDKIAKKVSTLLG